MQRQEQQQHTKAPASAARKAAAHAVATALQSSSTCISNSTYKAAACKDINSSSVQSSSGCSSHSPCKGSSMQRQQQQHAKAATAAVRKGSSPYNGHGTCQGRSMPCTLGCSAQSWACLFCAFDSGSCCFQGMPTAACPSLYQLVQMHICLSWYTSVCPNDESRPAGSHAHWPSHVTDSDLGFC